METTRMNDYERDVLVPLVCDLLMQAGGLPLSSMRIADEIRRTGHAASTRQVRRCVNHIRVNGIIPCVASSPKGFFVASNESEISECISTLEALADSIQEVIEALRGQMYNKFGFRL